MRNSCHSLRKKIRCLKTFTNHVTHPVNPSDIWNIPPVTYNIWRFPKMGYRQIIQVINDHDLVLKHIETMVTWGSKSF